MKNMRKFFALFLAVMMVMSLATTAFAENGDAAATPATYTLTLNGAQAGHTYTAYQIFAGDLSGDTLSNIVWGSGVTEAGQTALGKAADKAETLTSTEAAEAFAAEVAVYLTNGTESSAVSNSSCTISGLEAGYYLIATTAVTDQNGVYTYYIMKVVKDTDATIKADVPEIDKTVNDSDANIGDTVTFTLTATMPSNLQGYETYKVIFHDTLSAGLDFTEGSVKVMIGEKDVTSSFTVAEENGTLTISCNNVLDQAVGVTTSSQIVVTYNAVVDSDAIIGTDGNPNKVYLEYSNDPNWNGEGDEPTGDTPEKEVFVYTWEIPVFKYTKGEGDTKTPLAGAGFTLYDGETVVKLTKAEGEDNIYKVDPAGTVDEILTDDTGKFEIEGLEQGTYVLKETTTPAGYNTCDDVTVVIGENGVLTVGEATVTTVEILNQSGATLPETGGMGTTLFYIVGAAMVLAAVVLLVTKKRMASAE